MTKNRIQNYKREIRNNKEIIKYLKSKKTDKEIDTILSRLQ